MSWLLLLLSTVATAADEAALLEVYDTWTTRTVAEMRLPGSPAPSRSVIMGIDADQVFAHARAGALMSRDAGRIRSTVFEVVVGTDALNSSRLQTGRGGPESAARLNLVPEGAGIAIERDLWLASDSSYKQAIRRLEQKTAGRAAQSDEPVPDDWRPAQQQSGVLVEPNTVPAEEVLSDLAVSASAIIASRGQLDVADVYVRVMHGSTLRSESGGLSMARPNGMAVIYAEASVVTPEGVYLHDWRQWVARTAEELPTLAELEAPLSELGDAVAARAAAPTDLEVAYEGPVVFEGEAVADLLYGLLAPQVQGTPPEPRPGVSYRRQVRSGPRIGRRVLPTGWEVRDEPGAVASFASVFAVDQEGVLAQPVKLVSDGRVTDLLMTQVPRHDRTASNGHARGSVQGPLEARPTNLVVTPPRLDREKRAAKELASMQRANGLDEVLVVTRLSRSREGSIGSPAAAVWRSADGTERPAQRLVFEGIDRRTLRDIVIATGTMTTTARLLSFAAGGTMGTTSGLPMTITAPSRLVVQDLELVHPGPDAEPRVLAPPTAVSETP